MTNTSGWLTGNMLVNTQTWRKWYCERAVPRSPPAPMKASGLPLSGESFGGRDAQSMAFLSTPYGVVVLGRCNEERIGHGDSLLEPHHGLRGARGFHIAVVERNGRQIKGLQCHIRRQELGGNTEKGGVERSLAQAARKAQNVDC